MHRQIIILQKLDGFTQSRNPVWKCLTQGVSKQLQTCKTTTNWTNGTPGKPHYPFLGNHKNCASSNLGSKYGS